MSRRKKQLETVSSHDYWVAFTRWQRYWSSQDGSTFGWQSFVDYTGVLIPDLDKPTFQARHYIARKIRLLNSDHYIAFLNAYKARKNK